jgi:hypothetical protein
MPCGSTRRYGTPRYTAVLSCYTPRLTCHDTAHWRGAALRDWLRLYTAKCHVRPYDTGVAPGPADPADGSICDGWLNEHLYLSTSACMYARLVLLSLIIHQ